MSQFEQELQAAGYTGGSMDFYRQVLQVFVEDFPDHTYEWLARQPSLGVGFCEHFRVLMGLPLLEEKLIMGGLENGRKKRVRPIPPFSLN